MSLRSEFLAGLCEEHSSELAFLYGQRLRVMDEAMVRWSLLRDLEERIEAHAVAMVVEPEPVAAEVQRCLAADDPGLRYAGLRALAGDQPSARYWECFAATNWDDGEHARAAMRALLAVTTSAWSGAIAEQLTRSHGAAASALATVAAVHRLPVGAAIADIARHETAQLATLLWALGQLDYAPALSLLHTHLHAGAPQVRQSAALAVLRIAGQQEILPLLLPRIATEPWVVLPLVLCGSARAATALVAHAPAVLAEVDWLQALGLVGCPSSLDRLLSALAQEPSAGAAAAALHLLTGAALGEEVISVDEQMLEPDELAELRAGRLDPRRVGDVHRRLSRDAHIWRRWLAEHRSSFVAGQYYRMGSPFAVRAALPGLMSEWLPRGWRDLQAQELEMRSGLRFGYSSELPVSEQQRRLAAALATLATPNGRDAGIRLQAGRAGQPTSHEQSRAPR